MHQTFIDFFYFIYVFFTWDTGCTVIFKLAKISKPLTKMQTVDPMRNVDLIMLFIDDPINKELLYEKMIRLA